MEEISIDFIVTPSVSKSAVLVNLENCGIKQCFVLDRAFGWNTRNKSDITDDKILLFPTRTFPFFSIDWLEGVEVASLSCWTLLVALLWFTSHTGE